MQLLLCMKRIQRVHCLVIRGVAGNEALPGIGFQPGTRRSIQYHLRRVDKQVNVVDAGCIKGQDDGFEVLVVIKRNTPVRE